LNGNNTESIEQKQEKKYNKIPPPPILPKKKLSDEVKVLISSEDSKRCSVYLRRIEGCFNNLDIVSEPDIEDALSSINILLGNRIKVSSLLTPLFSVIAKVVLDFKKEIASKLRHSLVIIF